MGSRTASTTTATVLTGLLATVLTACGPAMGGSGESEDEARTIRYQTLSGVNLVEVADALGYLDDFELERVGDVSGGPESLQTLATGETDIATSYNGSVIKLASTGVPITSVLTYSGATEQVGSSLLVREDSPLREPEDLVGTKVGVNTLGANAEAIVDTWLREGGLTEDEIAQVTLVPVPGTTAESTLREGQVDAALLGRGEREKALSGGGLRSLVSDYELFGEYNIGTVAVADAFIDDNPDVLRELVSGMSEANDWLADHSVEEARELMVPYLEERGRDEEASALQYWVGNGVVTPAGLIDEQDFTLPLEWLEAEGEIDPGSVDVEDIYTNEFNPAAED